MIGKDEAVALAQEAAQAAGWAWVDPVDISWRSNWFGKRGKWEILTNAKGLGAKIRIVVRDDGQILEKGYVPR
jgi:hypothetical protein